MKEIKKKFLLDLRNSLIELKLITRSLFYFLRETNIDVFEELESYLKPLFANCMI